MQVLSLRVIDAERIVWRSLDMSIRIWDVNLGESVKVLEEHNDVCILYIY